MRGVRQWKFRSTWGGERECKRKKSERDLEVGTRRENKYWTEGEERRCRMCYEDRERERKREN
jgi:hypothetical protein